MIQRKNALLGITTQHVLKGNNKKKTKKQLTDPDLATLNVCLESGTDYFSSCRR